MLSVGAGEKLTDDEVDALLTGVEDSQGQVNYEGRSMVHSCNVQFVGLTYQHFGVYIYKMSTVTFCKPTL